MGKFKYSDHNVYSNGGLIQIEQTEKPKKYKHDDEDAWLKDHPGKKFKPFDPERKLAYKFEKK